MLVSGGKLLAISKVNTDGVTVSGDGVKTPISLCKGVVPGAKTYDVQPGSDNIKVDTTTAGDHTIFKISAAPGGQGGITYHGEKYVNVNNTTSAIGLDDSIINSASSGWNALDLINKNSAKWIEGKTYTQGDNINITNQVVSGRDWTPELNTKLDVIVYSTWSAGVEQSAADLSAAIKAIPMPKNYDDVSAIVNGNSANWNTTYTTVNGNSANWNESYSYINGFSGDFNTWSASVNQSADDLSAAIKALPVPKYYDDVSAIVNGNSANWNESYNYTYNFSGDFNTWSAKVENSAAGLSAAIKALPTPKYYDDVSAIVYNNSANWNESYSYINGFSGDFNIWSADINTWSASVEQSAANMSAYINDNEQYWINSSVNVQTNTPSLLNIASAYDDETKTITYTVSAKAGEGTKYEAGDWIDSDELGSGVISVSGYKNLKAQAPLYFEEDDTDPDHIVWIKYNGSEPVTQKRGVVIVNGFNLGRSSEDNYHNEGGGVECTEVPSDMTGEYTFHFERPMAIQININANFIVAADMADSMGEVGFNGVTYEGMSLTNDITFNMLGAIGSNYYACSTIARIENVGGTWPEGGLDLKFSFKYDEGFIARIENPCISIHEIIGRGDN